MGWLEMELVLIAQVYIPSFRLSPQILFRLQVFSLLCVPFWLLAFVFVHEPKNSCYLLSSPIQLLYDEQFLKTHASYRSQNMRTDEPRGAVGLRFYPLGWSASASFLLPACAPASNFNNDLYSRTRSPSHLAFEPQSSNLPLRRQRPLQSHTKGPSIRKSARLPAIRPLAAGSTRPFRKTGDRECPVNCATISTACDTYYSSM